MHDLVDHMVGGMHHLGSAIGGTEPCVPRRSTPAKLRAGVDAGLAGLAQPGALDRTYTSPLGVDETVREASAGTFMDVLIHTWDLATATAQIADLDPELIVARAAMLLPDMPERGRAATPQARLLAAMGRTP